MGSASSAGNTVSPFRKLLGEPDVPFGSQLKGMSKQTPLMAAAAAGERTAKSLNLGDSSAAKLREAVEEQLRVLVLFVDAPESISGAACHLHDGDYVLINRNEPSFRRNFNLGHELFHILTWNEMPPARVDAISRARNTRSPAPSWDIVGPFPPPLRPRETPRPGKPK